VASVAASFLTVCVLGSAAAQVTPSAGPAAGGSAPWAYGGIVSKSWGGVGGSYRYDASETLGFAVVLHETTGSPGNYTLQVNRTMGVLLSVEYCLPSCSHPSITASVSFHAWESVHASLNLTEGASVLVAGNPTAALGLRSSSLTVAVGVHEASRVVDAGVVLRSRNISVGLDANSSTVFAPSLGLVPLTLPAAGGESWTSTSGFVETGAANWSVLASLGGGVLSINEGGRLSLNSSGNVTLNGTTDGSTIPLGGSAFDVVALTLSGPFVLREGFLLVPTHSDLFAGSTPSWLPSGASLNGSASVSQEDVDVAASPMAGGHLGVDGSKLLWSSAAANPAQVSSGGAVEPAAMPLAAGGNSTSVQGAPVSVAQATADQNCLTTGLGCPTSGGPRNWFGALVVLGIGAVVAAVAVALIAERRKVPPPTYPNATLYPPGTASTGPSDGNRRPGPPEPPPPDDPLGHLW